MANYEYINHLTNDAYTNVRTAIVQQAIADYRRALRHNDTRQIFYLERWFLGDWGEWLSGQHGAYIIERVRKEERRC